jgi:hypothetical protein
VIRLGSLLVTAAIGLFLLPSTARAVPSFARQTGMSCIACHSEFPILTDYGRQFKLGGYTLGSGQTELPPISFMLQPSFTHTEKGQAGGAAPNFKSNNNTALDQASIFYSGKLFGPYADKMFSAPTAAFLDKFGTFTQVTYDGIGKSWAWDNAEIRYADTGTIAGKSVAYGIYTNNNPTLQDPWNTLPAWGFPFGGSALAPTPGAATLIDGGLSHQVVSLGGYAMIDHHFYVDLAGYSNLSTSFQKAVGVDPTGETEVSNIAPYWRAAYTNSFGNNSLEVGMFGMYAATYPGSVRGVGKDHTTDWGLDSQFQTSIDKHDITASVTGIYESADTGASKKLGDASHSSDELFTLRTSIDYLYDKTYGGAIGYFITDGNRDTARYPDSAKGSPLSDGLVLQLNYLPINKSGGPSFWPMSNVKISLQYVIYNRFNGSRSNYDGGGGNASDNNTLYFQTWFAF